MRYSYYVEMNRLLASIIDAAAFVLQSQDQKLKKNLLKSSVKAWKSIQSILLKDQDSNWEEDIFSTLKSCKSMCQKAVDVHMGDSLEFYIELIQTFCPLFEEQVQVRYRVVFLSDLGGKWDSMRSVYEEYRRRLDCDVTVVLMPIFRQVERNGKLEQETVYEDYFTPMGIPYVEYTQYDLKKDCPDLVFTSNPYDSTILPQFWAQEVAKVSRLVYLPYFAVDMLHQNSLDAICKLSIYEFAWKTIVQSEEIQKYHKQYAKKHGKNVLVTGLPKWDEVVHLRKNGLKESERRVDWESKFQGKTVIMWNTFYDFSRSSLCHWDKIMAYFQSHPNMVLLWRMHPMTIPVTKLYYSSSCWHQLQKMLKKAEEMDNIVLDSNVSYCPSFWYSHAQISDFSSLMSQYLLLDKPLLWIIHDSWITTTEIIHHQWMEKAKNWKDICRFLDDISQNKDKTRESRKQICQTDLSLADGHCGERVVQSLFLEMYQEDGLLDKEQYDQYK